MRIGLKRKPKRHFFWRTCGYEFSEGKGFGQKYQAVFSRKKAKLLFKDGSIKTIKLLAVGDTNAR